MPAAKTAIPVRIRAPAMMALIQWNDPILATGQKRDEKEKGRPRDDARGFGVGYVLPSPVHFHVRSRRCWRLRSPEPSRYDN
jgi:hypothetical protein